jgi:hypothetical protein
LGEGGRRKEVQDHKPWQKLQGTRQVARLTNLHSLNDENDLKN